MDGRLAQLAHLGIARSLHACWGQDAVDFPDSGPSPIREWTAEGTDHGLPLQAVPRRTEYRRVSLGEIFFDDG